MDDTSPEKLHTGSGQHENSKGMSPPAHDAADDAPDKTEEPVMQQKRGRGRPPKLKPLAGEQQQPGTATQAGTSGAAQAAATDDATAAVASPAKKRGRPPKVKANGANLPAPEAGERDEAAEEEGDGLVHRTAPIQRKRGRPPKASSSNILQQVAGVPPRKRGRPRKVAQATDVAVPRKRDRPRKTAVEGTAEESSEEDDTEHEADDEADDEVEEEGEEEEEEGRAPEPKRRGRPPKSGNSSVQRTVMKHGAPPPGGPARKRGRPRKLRPEDQAGGSSPKPQGWQPAVKDMQILRLAGPGGSGSSAGWHCSRAVAYGALLHVGLLTPDMTEGWAPEGNKHDVGEQTKQVLSLLDQVLEQAGVDKRRLLSVCFYCTRPDMWASVSEEWNSYVHEDHQPTVSFLPLGAAVGMEGSGVGVEATAAL